MSNTLNELSETKRLVTEKAAGAFLNRQEQRLCNWPTIGSIKRKWLEDPEKRREYHKFCDNGVE